MVGRCLITCSERLHLSREYKIPIYESAVQLGVEAVQMGKRFQAADVMDATGHAQSFSTAKSEWRDS